MYLADQRIVVQARPSSQQDVGFEVVMLGHCGGEADLQQLSSEALAEISALGLVKEVEIIRQCIAKNKVPEEKNLRYLYHIPLPVLSVDDFQAIFPKYKQWSAAYKSQLAGEHYWLAKAVADFFNENENMVTGAKKLWIIRVDEQEGRAGFLPETICDFNHISDLKGLHLALLPPAAGLIAMPDLERLQIPQMLSDVPRVRLKNPAPAFLPCSEKQPADDGHRERRNSSELPDNSEPWKTHKIISNIVDSIHRYRPDMQCLWTLSLEYQRGLGRPSLSLTDLSSLQTFRDGMYVPSLHRMQFLFPYLRRNNQLYSSCGLIAGRIATQTIQKGAWRSIAGTLLSESGLPYPEVDHRQVAQLRETYGIGVLVRKAEGMYLDDERLASVYKPKFGQALNDSSAQRSGEFVRFMGFVHRQLKRLGESFLFSLDPLDPRPQLLLEQFFNRLHELGALRGRVAEQAYSIRQIPTAENTLLYEIEIAPSFPVDRIRLSFSHQGDINSSVVKCDGF